VEQKQQQQQEQTQTQTETQTPKKKKPPTIMTPSDRGRKAGLSYHRTRGLSAIKNAELRRLISKMGGLATKEKYQQTDPDYYSRAGAKGGAAVKAKYGNGYFRMMAKKSAIARAKDKKQ
jgi:hypothetical protein